jgi:hypothetical protein
MKGGPQPKPATFPFSERRIVIAGYFGSPGLTFVLGLFAAR